MTPFGRFLLIRNNDEALEIQDWLASRPSVIEDTWNNQRAGIFLFSVGDGGRHREFANKALAAATGTESVRMADRSAKAVAIYRHAPPEQIERAVGQAERAIELSPNDRVFKCMQCGDVPPGAKPRSDGLRSLSGAGGRSASDSRLTHRSGDSRVIGMIF